MNEEQRNEVFLQSQTVREETFREWLSNKEIEVPDAGTLAQIRRDVTQNTTDISTLKTHNHDERYAQKSHNHDGAYATASHNHNTQYATLTHNHDDRYSTVNHNHDTAYASKTSEHTHNNKTALDGITSAKITEWNNKSNFSGSYTDLTNKPKGLATETFVNQAISRVTNPIHINALSFGIKEGRNVDVVENTRCFQEAINYCKNDKVLVFPSGEFIFNSVNLGEKNNITIIGASSSFATFAQKDIYTGAITDTLTKIICNAPTGETFFNHKSCVLIMKDIAFYNLKKDGSGNFTKEEAKTNILMQHTRSEDQNKNTEKGKVFLTNCAFFGWKVCFGSEFTFQHLEDEWETGKRESDYEYFKQSCVMASRCRFTRNGVAINQSVDARIIDCSFNKNDYAIVFRENSGFSTVSNCRIEWNIYNGIYCEKAHEVTVADCEFDCNGYAGLYAVENTNSNFNGIFRRNGAKVETTDENREDYINNVHIYARGNVNCNFVGSNTTVKPISDVGSAPERPSNCSNFSENINCVISMNNLTGCTKSDKKQANKFENNIECIIENNMTTYVGNEKNVQQNWYYPKDILGTINGTNGVPAERTQETYEQFYSWVLDKLKDANRNYITKTTLGKDSSNTFNIYRYDFTPLNYERTILILSNVHGNEYTSFFGLCRFLEDMVNHSDENSLLNYLRTRVRVVVIPIVNPWGFINSNRRNVNGVDLNRNCDYRWAEYTTTSSQQGQPYYKGTAPFSEKESQYVKKVVEDIKDDNFVASIDLHTITTIDAEKVLYYPRFQSNAINELARVVKNYQSELDNNREIFSSSTVPTFSNWIGHITGANVCNPEWNNTVYGGSRNAFLMRKHVEWIGNIIITLAKSEKAMSPSIGEPYSQMLMWNRDASLGTQEDENRMSGKGHRILKSENYNSFTLSQFFMDVDQEYIIDISGHVQVMVEKECTLHLEPLVYQQNAPEQNYSVMSKEGRFEEVVTLPVGTHYIPIKAMLQGFHTNYNDDSSSRAGQVHFRLRAKTNVANSVWITGYKATLMFTPSNRGKCVSIEKLVNNQYEVVFPTRVVEDLDD